MAISHPAPWFLRLWLQLFSYFCRIQPSQFHFSKSSPSLSRKCRGFVLQCQHDSCPDPSCNFHGFVLHCQHDPFPDPSYNFHGFMHDFSLGLSCTCHSFVLHCQHSCSVKLLDNPPSFCQLSSDCFPHSTTPRILHAFTLLLSSRVHTF